LNSEEDVYQEDMQRATSRLEAVVNTCIDEGHLDLSDLALTMVYLGRSAATIVLRNLPDFERAEYAKALARVEADAEKLADVAERIDECLKMRGGRVPVMVIKPAQA